MLLLAGTGFHGFPIFPALLFSLISAYLMFGALSSRRPGGLLFAAGACAGVAALFRHDMGFYLVLAEALVFAWSVLVADRAAHSGRISRIARAALPFSAGLLLVAAPAIVWLIVKVPLGDLWFNLFVVPATIYPQVRALPFPPLPDPRALLPGAAITPRVFNDGFDVYLPLVVAAATLLYLAVTSRRSTARWTAAPRPAAALADHADCSSSRASSGRTTST